MPPQQVVTSFIGIIVVLIAAYYATYYIGQKASGKSRGGGKGKSRGRHIKLVERFAVSKDKSFCIVEIAGKVYIIGMSNQSMTLLDTLEASELAKFAEESGDPAALGKSPGGLYSGRYVGKLAAFIAQKTGKDKGAAESKNVNSGTFADNMQSARKKDTSGQSDGSEGEE